MANVEEGAGRRVERAARVVLNRNSLLGVVGREHVIGMVEDGVMGDVGVCWRDGEEKKIEGSGTKAIGIVVAKC